MCNCVPTIGLYENFHKFSKQTKINKIDQYLPKIGNYNYFEKFWIFLFFRDKFGIRISNPLKFCGSYLRAGLILLLMLKLWVSFKGGSFSKRGLFQGFTVLIFQNFCKRCFKNGSSGICQIVTEPKSLILVRLPGHL